MAQPQNRQPTAMDNLRIRQALLASALRYRKDLGIYNMTAGQTTRVKLFNVGIITRLTAQITVPVTIGTATATPSKKAPYNVLTKIKLTDYDGTDRVNCSGFQLFILDSVRNRMPYGYNLGGPIYDANGSTEKGGIISSPNVPTAVGTANILYYVEIPVCYDPQQDLRGAILAQTAVGEMYLAVDMNSSYYTNNDVESIYSGGGTTTVVSGGQATIRVWQDYLLPQAIGNTIPIPPFDLLTVYELNGAVRSSDNLAVGTEKLISYPNVRSVIGAYFNYVEAGTMSASDISGFRLIANGNNILWDHNLYSKQIEQRNYCQGDLQMGVYFNLHRDKPIETALFGNVQEGITPSAVGATPYIELMFESFYTKGAQLPGLSQAQ
jgi:hypothetical protein